MLLVAGISLKNLKPRVWNPESPWHVPSVRAVMVSYGDFHRMPPARRAAMESGIHAYLGVPEHVQVFLDNGSFYFLRHDGDTSADDYVDFVRHARPDWYPIPRDVIPNPAMSHAEQQNCLRLTMDMNRRYSPAGCVPVVHIGDLLDEYICQLTRQWSRSTQRALAIGGIVPNLLRAPRARPYRDILDATLQVRRSFAASQLHVFGIGGTATLHLACLLGMDSADSSGWRNRAARGIIQLPGSGDRVVADLGKWRGRRPSDLEWEILRHCDCPGCRRFGLKGLSASGIDGFSHRATHNLFTLARELDLIESHLNDDTYESWYSTHLDNSIYRPLIDYTLGVRSKGFG